jgi:hypothetical protein
MFEEELAEALGRARHARGGKARGYRNGHRDRQLVGTFGTETVRVPRARIEGEEGKAREWRSKPLPRYRRLTKNTEALITSVYADPAASPAPRELGLSPILVSRKLIGHNLISARELNNLMDSGSIASSLNIPSTGFRNATKATR